ncbi:hypothetical protein BAN44_0862 [Bacillus anthracis]|nr:hypothetical protein BAN44_0862 [Bacillus anthracis]
MGALDITCLIIFTGKLLSPQHILFKSKKEVISCITEQKDGT